METTIEPGRSARHFAVVRYFTDDQIGLVKQTIADNLTLHEARGIAKKEANQVPGEEIVVIDLEKTGLEAEISE